MSGNKILILCVTVALSGCIKTGTREIVMPDQEIKGNQGFIVGTPPAVTRPSLPRKKKIIDVEVELPPVFEKVPPKYTEDKEIWGNAGYIYTGREEKMKYIYVPTKVKKPTLPEGKLHKEEIPQMGEIPKESAGEEKVAPPRSVQPRFMEYKVSKGESLWTIARKVYGDPTKWTVIYENNRDILSAPDKLRPGMVLKIPLSEEVEYIK